MRTAAICNTCATYENALCIIYNGPYLPNLNISPLESLESALIKINLNTITTVGAGNPTISPTHLGQFYVNTSTGVIYYATSLGQGANSWTIIGNGLGFTAEDTANKTTSASDIVTYASSIVKYPSVKSIKDYVDQQLLLIDLQTVLNNGHALVNEVNTQGTNAGGGTFSGTNINAFGLNSTANNSGSNVNAMGNTAAYNNSGDHVNAFGDGAGVSNTFDNVTILGYAATAGADDQLVFSNGAGYNARLSNTNLTSNQTYQFPNTSGTIALTSDIPTDYWKTGGNSGTTAGTNFIGTSDAIDFVTKTNATERIRVGSTGNVGIGRTASTFLLEVNKDASVNDVRVGRGKNDIASNTTLGFESSNTITTGNNNTAVGYQALKQNTNGNNNTAVGYISGLNNQNGGANTAVGMNSLTGNQNGNANTAIGTSALANSVDGDNNTAVGAYSLVNIFNGSNGNNTAIGRDSGVNVTTGGTNTLIGAYTAVTLTTGASNTVIGQNVDVPSATTSGNILIGDGQGNVRFKDDGTDTILPRLAGTGVRIVTAGVNGELSTTTASSSYKVYSALVQYSVSGATATVLENTLGVTVTWATTFGITSATASSSIFTINKTTISADPYVSGSGTLYNNVGVRQSDTLINLNSVKTSDSSTGSGFNVPFFVEIRVYP